MRLASLSPLPLILLLLVLPNSATAEVNPYDVQHYDLLIEPDFALRTISLTSTMTIANPNLEKSFSFGLNDHYESVEVTSNATPIEVHRDVGSVTVSINKPPKALSLVFTLKGRLGKSPSEDRDVIEEQSLFLLWSDRFYPIDFSDWATAKITILLPPGFQAIAPGRLKQVQKVRERIEYTFETSGPEVNYSVFADARWVKTEREINGIRMQTLLHPESQKFARQIFNTSSKILKFYSETFCPYPFGQFSFVTIKGMYARRAFSGFVGYEPGYLQKEFMTTGHDAHETSLLWWGHMIRGAGSGSSQWLEGFGDYAEILYDEKYHKPIPKIFQFFRTKYLASPPEKDLLYSELRGSTDQALVHGKYPWLMHLIRYVVGDSRFKRAMRLLFERYKFRTLSMDEFILTLEEGGSRPLRWFREEWLERRGVPIISMKSTIEEEGRTFKLTCMLEQEGNIYHFPLEIGIETQRVMRIQKVDLTERQTTFTVKMKTKPSKIYLDPNGWILMKKMDK